MLRNDVATAIRWVALLSVCTLIIVGIMLPNTSLAWLRSEYHWIGQPLNWIEGLWPLIDLVHLLLFSFLGAVLLLVLQGTSWLKLFIGVAFFAMASEIVQFWVPGRTPRMSDFIVDMVGVLIGGICVNGCRMVCSRWR